jgi:hypothetical protein
VVFLGYIPPVNTMPEIGARPVEQPAYPLEMLRCEACGLSQIGCDVDQTVLFPYSYPYLSGTTRILRENFADLYRQVVQHYGLGADDLVVDIGSNDGSLLINFKEGGHRVLGVEPSKAGVVANERGVETITAYFNLETAKKVREERGPAKVITAANVFAHITDVHRIVEAIKTLLADGGIFISENHYLFDLLKTVQYDTIYHEHLRYYDLGSLNALFDRHGMEIIRTQRIPTHGGSIRVYSALKGTHPVDASVAEQVREEEEFGLHDGRAFADFRRNVVNSKLGLHALLNDIVGKGGRVYGIGAPSRASTLINYVGLDDGIMGAVMETSSSHKIGKYIPGTIIPVLDEAKLIEDQPEYALLLSWHIADELIGILQRKGFKGRFIVPLPTPHLV